VVDEVELVEETERAARELGARRERVARPAGELLAAGARLVGEVDRVEERVVDRQHRPALEARGEARLGPAHARIADVERDGGERGGTEGDVVAPLPPEEHRLERERAARPLDGDRRAGVAAPRRLGAELRPAEDERAVAELLEQRRKAHEAAGRAA